MIGFILWSLCLWKQTGSHKGYLPWRKQIEGCSQNQLFFPSVRTVNVNPFHVHLHNEPIHFSILPIFPC